MEISPSFRSDAVPARFRVPLPYLSRSRFLVVEVVMLPPMFVFPFPLKDQVRLPVREFAVTLPVRVRESPLVESILLFQLQLLLPFFVRSPSRVKLCSPTKPVVVLLSCSKVLLESVRSAP